MRTTIDAAGRIVVPKALRVAMGFQPGQQVDIVFSDSRLEVEIAPLDAMVTTDSGWPVITPVDPPEPLTDDIVREAIEATRR
ncbi:MAG: AbrB/MazE/SpoVT family DNA-binding domain-containing protein [Actinobacteria bacterium]|jgi:AbrB family looped-hinge helix DNA binding protein|nr:AbrB/MazE/SpoVT family DNA-binding domain-containing protein [Actinomycetota bacterium]